MADFYAFISPSELQSAHDPVRLLKSATTLQDLLADPTYDPDDGGGFWARGKIEGPGLGADVVNQRTGLSEPAVACGVDH
jgi:hypothetical protein